jgi:hypothetical protein
VSINFCVNEGSSIDVYDGSYAAETFLKEFIVEVGDDGLGYHDFSVVNGRAGLIGLPRPPLIVLRYIIYWPD